jgi:hypothetical protein
MTAFLTREFIEDLEEYIKYLEGGKMNREGWHT